MKPLSEILEILKVQHNVKLYAPNLHKPTLVDPQTRESVSILEYLARRELARTEQHGQRRRWLVAMEAVPLVLDIVAESRPGRRPGKKVTLDAAQTLALLERFSNRRKGTDPIEELRIFLSDVTGWTKTTVERIDVVGLRLSKR